MEKQCDDFMIKTLFLTWKLALKQRSYELFHPIPAFSCSLFYDIFCRSQPHTNHW